MLTKLFIGGLTLTAAAVFADLPDGGGVVAGLPMPDRAMCWLTSSPCTEAPPLMAEASPDRFFEMLSGY